MKKWEKWLLNALARYRADIKGEGGDSYTAVNCILIGKSQEGKTRLALSLIGFRNKELDEVEKILRLDNPIGRSSTKVISIYRLTDEVLSPVSLEKLKNSVKSALKNPKGRTVKIDIPRGHEDFKNSGLKEIIDFIGIDPRDDEEGRRAIEMLEKYFYGSDIIIYVVRANHIQNLSENRGFSEVMDYWKVNPNNCVIVITYAYEQGDRGKLRKELEHIRNPNEAFNITKEYYEKQIRRQTGYNEKLPLLLPVSLKYTKLTEKEIEATEIALKKLADKIRLSKAGVVNRVCMGFSYAISKNKQITQLEEKRKRLIRRKCSIHKKIKERWELIENLNSKMGDIQKHLDLLNNKKIDSLSAWRDVFLPCFPKLSEELYQNLLNGIQDGIGKNPLIYFTKSSNHREMSEMLINFLCENNKDCEKLMGEVEDIHKIIRKLRKGFNNFYVDVLSDKSNIKKFKKQFIVRKGFFLFKHTDNNETRVRIQNNKYEVKEFIEDLLLQTVNELDSNHKYRKYMEDLRSTLKKYVSDTTKKKLYLVLLKVLLNREIKKRKEEKESISKEIAITKEKLKKLKNPELQALNFTKHISEEFVNFWNETVYTINSSNDILTKIDGLINLYKAKYILDSFIENCLNVRKIKGGKMRWSRQRT